MSSGRSFKRRWTTRAILLLLSVSLLSTAIGCSSLHEHMAMKNAAKAYKAQKYTEAAKDFEQALAINPDRAENWKYLAYSYWSLVEPGSKAAKDQEYTDKALAAFQKYLSMVGKDDAIQDYMINLYINQNRLEEGIKFYESQLQSTPNDPRIIQTLSTMYAKLNNFPKSLEYSLRKAELTPDDPSGWLFVGALCWNRSYNKEDPDEERGKIVDQGMEALNKAIALEPNNFNGHLFMNLLYRQKAELAKNAAADQTSRRKKRELLAQADDYLRMANQERDTALAIRKGGSAEPAAPASGQPSPAANSN